MFIQHSLGIGGWKQKQFERAEANEIPAVNDSVN